MRNWGEGWKKVQAFEGHKKYAEHQMMVGGERRISCKSYTQSIALKFMANDLYACVYQERAFRTLFNRLRWWRKTTSKIIASKVNQNSFPSSLRMPPFFISCERAAGVLEWCGKNQCGSSILFFQYHFWEWIEENPLESFSFIALYPSKAI